MRDQFLQNGSSNFWSILVPLYVVECFPSKILPRYLMSQFSPSNSITWH